MRGEINLTERRCKRRSLVEYSCSTFSRYNRGTGTQQFHHASVASDSTGMLVERIHASEIFFAMHREHHRILVRVPVFSTSIHEWNPFSSPLHGFRSCITVEGAFFRLSCCYSSAQHSAAPCFLTSHNKNTETRESRILVLTSQAHFPQFSVSRGFVPNQKWYYTYLTASYEGKKKWPVNLFFSNFIREQHEDSIKQIKNSVIYTLMRFLESKRYFCGVLSFCCCHCSFLFFAKRNLRLTWTQNEIITLKFILARHKIILLNMYNIRISFTLKCSLV